jgi:hypothetical protein
MDLVLWIMFAAGFLTGAGAFPIVEDCWVALARRRQSRLVQAAIARAELDLRSPAEALAADLEQIRAIAAARAKPQGHPELAEAHVVQWLGWQLGLDGDEAGRGFDKASTITCPELERSGAAGWARWPFPSR